MLGDECRREWWAGRRTARLVRCRERRSSLRQRRTASVCMCQSSTLLDTNVDRPPHLYNRQDNHRAQQKGSEEGEQPGVECAMATALAVCRCWLHLVMSAVRAAAVSARGRRG
jgi:hypothetical protein